MSDINMGWEGGHLYHTSVQFADIFESDTGDISRRAGTEKPFTIGCPPGCQGHRSRQN